MTLILLFAAVSALRGSRTTLVAARADTVDAITAYESRFEELRQLLPAGSVVGYLADPEPPALQRAESRLFFRSYLLTQYALTPAIVVRHTESELVVGNYVEPATADSAAALGLSVVREFGDGVVLLRRRTP